MNHKEEVYKAVDKRNNLKFVADCMGAGPIYWGVLFRAMKKRGIINIFKLECSRTGVLDKIKDIKKGIILTSVENIELPTTITPHIYHGIEVPERGEKYYLLGGRIIPRDFRRDFCSPNSPPDSGYKPILTKLVDGIDFRDLGESLTYVPADMFTGVLEYESKYLRIKGETGFLFDEIFAFVRGNQSISDMKRFLKDRYEFSQEHFFDE